MARPVPYSPLASYTVEPLSWPDELPTEPEQTENITSLNKVVLLLVVCSMIISTIVGNALVCLAVLLVRKLQQPANFLIVSLAVADCLVGLVVMPLALVHLLFQQWPLGRSMCKLWTTADLFLCTASIVNLCAISVDRYLVISRPLRYSAVRTTSRVLCYILIVWLIAALVSLSSHIISNLLESHESDSDSDCQVIQHYAYQIYATIISFYAPTLIMVILYVKIWRAAKRLASKDRSLSHCGGSGESQPHDELLRAEQVPGKKLSLSRLIKSERRMLHRPSALLNAVKVPLIRHSEGADCKARKTLGVIMSVFIICWFPFFSLAILKSCIDLPVPYWLDTLTLWLGYSNSMLNPAIYCKYNKEFRVPFREILSCRCSTLQLVIRQQSFTSRYGPAIARRNDSQPECSDV